VTSVGRRGAVAAFPRAGREKVPLEAGRRPATKRAVGNADHRTRAGSNREDTARPTGATVFVICAGRHARGVPASAGTPHPKRLGADRGGGRGAGIRRRRRTSHSGRCCRQHL
jgi:hypothetical protein